MNSEYVGGTSALGEGILPWAPQEDYREDLAAFLGWQGLLLVGSMMILTVPCCTLVCNRQLPGWYRYTFSLSYFSQFCSKGRYPNLISNSSMHTQEKICMDKQTSYHAKQLITLWAALRGKPQIRADKWIHICRRSLLIFSGHEKNVFSSDLWHRSFSPFACISAHGAIAVHAWPLTS